jgi:hypothetical protein
LASAGFQLAVISMWVEDLRSRRRVGAGYDPTEDNAAQSQAAMAEVLKYHIRELVDPPREPDADRARAAEELIEVVQSYLK